MNYYFLTKIFTLILPSFYGVVTPLELGEEIQMDVKYEIFDGNTYPEFDHLNEVTYKKAPNVMVKVFNK
jgi:hypothetical protein